MQIDLKQIAIVMIILFLLTYFIQIEKEQQDNQIQNIEEKVNVLTVDYEEFSLKQER